MKVEIGFWYLPKTRLFRTSDKTGTGFSKKTRPESPDPRFGLVTPLPQSVSTVLPSGLTRTSAMTRTATLSDANNLLSLTAQSDTLTINGKVFTSVYNYDAAHATRTVTTTSPLHRSSTMSLDATGHVTNSAVSGLGATAFGYDTRGRLETIDQNSGERVSRLTYDSTGFVDSVTDAMSRVQRFTYDGVGRVLTQTLPDARVITYTYDANGNLASVTPPS